MSRACACVVGPLSPSLPAILVIIVLALFTGLVVTGMPMETAVLTVATGSLLGVELVRRLLQMLPRRGLA